MSSYPFKKSILGMIPEGVTVDEDYVKQLAISKGIDIQTICNLWYGEIAVDDRGSSKEALQKTIDERDDTIESLEERLRTAILERDHYRKELSSPSKEIDLLNSQLDKSKASYVDLRTKYDKLKEDNQWLDNQLEESNQVNRDVHNENKKLYDNNRQLNKDLSDAEDTICKLREDIEEQYKQINYMKENCVSKQVAQEERKYAEIEIHNRINDTKDLIRAIHTISKFI